MTIVSIDCCTSIVSVILLFFFFFKESYNPANDLVHCMKCHLCPISGLVIYLLIHFIYSFPPLLLFIACFMLAHMRTLTKVTVNMNVLNTKPHSMCVSFDLKRANKDVVNSSLHLHLSLNAGVVGEHQMTSQSATSIFLCSPLLSGTWRTPGLSIP